MWYSIKCWLKNKNNKHESYDPLCACINKKMTSVRVASPEWWTQFSGKSHTIYIKYATYITLLTIMEPESVGHGPSNNFQIKSCSLPFSTPERWWFHDKHRFVKPFQLGLICLIQSASRRTANRTCWGTSRGEANGACRHGGFRPAIWMNKIQKKKCCGCLFINAYYIIYLI